MDKQKIVNVLIKKGEELFNHPYEKLQFTKVSEADDLYNDLEKYPHLFVLGCIMDRQMKAERAWLIPFKFSKAIGSPEFSKFYSLNIQEIKDIFLKEKLHRFNDIMATNFYSAIQKIKKDYNGEASNIWKNKPSSATVVRRFLEFKGAGIKIATMAANILAREFKIPMSDYLCIDISPDVHVRRVFKRLGLISKNASTEELVYCARELNPKYPGVFDLSTFNIGRSWCHPRKPDCQNCYLNKYCPKII